MNVTLPKKEKMKKRTIVIYSISIIACIIAIVVIIGIQVLGDDVINKLFGINKITNKTEQEEEYLKVNFEKLFNNELENKSDYNVSKIDNTKNIIFTNYQKEDKVEKNYELNVKIPYINIKNKTIQKYNEKISDIFETKAEEILKSTDNNVIYTVKYQAYIENNILSLIIYSDLKQNSSAQRTIYQTFNFNLETNKELNLEDIIKVYGLNKQEVQNKINDDIKEEEKKSQDLIDIGYNVFTRDTKSDIYNIENATEFFVHNNNLYIIYAYGNDQITSEMDLVVI